MYIYICITTITQFVKPRRRLINYIINVRYTVVDRVQHNFLVAFDACNNNRTRGVRTRDHRAAVAIAYIIILQMCCVVKHTHARITDIKLY